MSDSDDSSDPLPYTQVDRAVKPKATLLAGMLGTTPQHALGALVEFWDLNGDPRELERLLSEGKREVVLDGKTVAERFEVASGRMIEPSKLARLGLLEQKGPDEFRVRGMSRYFAPIEGRLESRRKGVAGGKASAEARKAKYGTAQPRSGPGSELVRTPVRDGFGTGSGPASALVGTLFEPPPKPPEAADSGQRTVEEDLRDKPAPPPEEPKVRRPSDQQDAFRWAQEVACQQSPGRVPEKEPETPLLNSQGKAILKTIGRSGFELAWRTYIANQKVRSAGCPWAWFATQWPSWHNRGLSQRQAGGKTEPTKFLSEQERKDLYADGGE